MNGYLVVTGNGRPVGRVVESHSDFLVVEVGRVGGMGTSKFPPRGSMLPPPFGGSGPTETADMPPGRRPSPP